MIYGYAVKYNGKFYKAGENVPEDISETKAEKKTARRTEKSNGTGKSDNSD